MSEKESSIFRNGKYRAFHADGEVVRRISSDLLEGSVVVVVIACEML